jgi:hypothetical protein
MLLVQNELLLIEVIYFWTQTFVVQVLEVVLKLAVEMETMAVQITQVLGVIPMMVVVIVVVAQQEQEVQETLMVTRLLHL